MQGERSGWNLKGKGEQSGRRGGRTEERERDPYLAIHELEFVSDLLPLSVGPSH